MRFPWRWSRQSEPSVVAVAAAELGVGRRSKRRGARWYVGLERRLRAPVVVRERRSFKRVLEGWASTLDGPHWDIWQKMRLDEVRWPSRKRVQNGTISRSGRTCPGGRAVPIIGAGRSVAKLLRHVAERFASQHGARPIRRPPIGRARGGLEWFVGRCEKSPDALRFRDHRQKLHAALALRTFEKRGQFNAGGRARGCECIAICPRAGCPAAPDAREGLARGSTARSHRRVARAESYRARRELEGAPCSRESAARDRRGEPSPLEGFARARGGGLR